MFKSATHILAIAAVTVAAAPTAAIACSSPGGGDQSPPAARQTSDNPTSEVKKNGVFVVPGLGRLVKSSRAH